MQNEELKTKYKKTKNKKWQPTMIIYNTSELKTLTFTLYSFYCDIIFSLWNICMHAISLLYQEEQAFEIQLCECQG